MRRNLALIGLFFIAGVAYLSILGATCSESQTGVKVGEGTAVPKAAKATSYGLGDVVKVGDHTISLVKAGSNEGKMFATFVVENLGEKDLNLSGFVQFSARTEDGSKLDSMLVCGNDLSGKVLPGEKLRGDVCWQGVPEPRGVITVQYEASMWGSGAVLWKLE